MSTPRITLEIPSSPDNLSRVEKFLDDLKRICDISEEIYFNILVAVSEAVTNAIVHGNKNNQEKMVSIDVFHDKSICVFTIEDEGEGFDYTKIKSPTLVDSFLKISGRGILLMKKLSRHLRFCKNGSCVKMFFYTRSL